MSRLKIIHYGHPLLSAKAMEVESLGSWELDLIDSMTETMYAADGIGLAATQVGVLQRIFVVDAHRNREKESPRDLIVFVNPVIIKESADDVSFEEGCLSIPKLYADVWRPAEITVQARDREFKPFEMECDGLLARVIQHELDHLDGVLYIDRLSEDEREKMGGGLRKIRENAKKSMPSEDQVYPMIEGEKTE